LTLSTAAGKILRAVSDLTGSGQGQVDGVGNSFGGVGFLLAAMARKKEVAKQLEHRSKRFIARVKRHGDQLPEGLILDELVSQIQLPEVEEMVTAAAAIARLVLIKPPLELGSCFRGLVPERRRQEHERGGWLDGKPFKWPGKLPFEVFLEEADYWANPREPAAPGASGSWTPRLEVPNGLETWAIVGERDDIAPPDAAVRFFDEGRVSVIAGAGHHDKGNPNQIVDLVDEILNGAPSGTRDLP
jgi:hypothetical protein